MIASYSGKQFVDPTCDYGDCNRLRNLPSAPAADNVIPPQESRVLFVDFAFGSLDRAPKAVVHHLYGQGAINPGSSSPAPIDYLAAPFDISAGTPRVIGPPVKGDHWIALNGCCLPGFPHRSSMASLNGQLINAQRFAIDWKRTDDKGAFYEGDRTKNESYVDYGEPIYAVADGTITATLDELEANAPGVLPANDPVLGPKITVQTVDGNHIVEDIGGGVWAFYAHLQKDTLLVKPGDKVKKGQVIAKLGNTGQLQRLPHALPAHERSVGARQRRRPVRHRPVQLRRPGPGGDDLRRRRLPERGFPHRRSAQAAAPQAGAAARVGHHRLPDRLRLTIALTRRGGRRHALHPILDGDAEDERRRRQDDEGAVGRDDGRDRGRHRPRLAEDGRPFGTCRRTPSARQPQVEVIEMRDKEHPHTCPYCDLRFLYATEVRDHVLHDHKEHAQAFLYVETHELP